MSAIILRTARRSDLAGVVKLLADDPLGQIREQYADPLPEGYGRAFDAIADSPNDTLLVAVARERLGERVVGVLQLTVIPSLTYQGRPRAQIEGVRVATEQRNAGLGGRMFRWAIDRAKKRGCHLVQFTTDKRRPDAHRFYEKLGFAPSHEGMKLKLE